LEETARGLHEFAMADGPHITFGKCYEQNIINQWGKKEVEEEEVDVDVVSY
jgi:hypothetical protein